MDSHERLIFVLGVPSGGTSCVAGILHHLGVDMGEPINSVRPYETFEDVRVKRYKRPTPVGHVTQSIMPEQKDTLRDFRTYCEMRLAESKGNPCGVKIGSTAWIGDSDPASLPIRIVRVHRPLEDCIRSNWQYGGESEDAAIRRAMQVAGYWAAAEELCLLHPFVELQYYALLAEPALWVTGIASALGLTPTDEQKAAACAFVDPEMRHV